MFFSVKTRNLKWEILIKNLFTLKYGMELRMKNSIIVGDSLKNPIFRGGGGVMKKQYKGALPKKGEGAWTVWRFRGWLAVKQRS